MAEKQPAASKRMIRRQGRGPLFAQTFVQRYPARHPAAAEAAGRRSCPEGRATSWHKVPRRQSAGAWRGVGVGRIDPSDAGHLLDDVPPIQAAIVDRFASRAGTAHPPAARTRAGCRRDRGRFMPQPPWASSVEPRYRPRRECPPARVCLAGPRRRRRVRPR